MCFTRCLVDHGAEDIIPPPSIKQAMEMEAEAERRRRAEVLQSEGDRQSEVNLAEGASKRARNGLEMAEK